MDSEPRPSPDGAATGVRRRRGRRACAAHGGRAVVRRSLGRRSLGGAAGSAAGSGCRACGGGTLDAGRRSRRRRTCPCGRRSTTGRGRTRRTATQSTVAAEAIRWRRTVGQLAQMVGTSRAPAVRPPAPRRAGLPMTVQRAGATAAGARTAPGAIAAASMPHLDATPPDLAASSGTPRATRTTTPAAPVAPAADGMPADIAALRALVTGEATPPQPGGPAPGIARERGSRPASSPTRSGAQDAARAERQPGAWLEHGTAWRRHVDPPSAPPAGGQRRGVSADRGRAGRRVGSRAVPSSRSLGRGRARRIW